MEPPFSRVTMHAASQLAKLRSSVRAAILATATFISATAAAQAINSGDSMHDNSIVAAAQAQSQKTEIHADTTPAVKTAQTPPDMRFFNVESDGILARYTTRHYITNVDETPAEVTFTSSRSTYTRRVPPNGSANIEGVLRDYNNDSTPYDIVSVRINGANPRKVDVVTKIIGYSKQEGFIGTLGVKMEKIDDIMVRPISIARRAFFFDTPQDPAYRLNGLFLSDDGAEITLIGEKPTNPYNLLDYTEFNIGQLSVAPGQLLQHNDFMRHNGERIAMRGAYGRGNTAASGGSTPDTPQTFAALLTNVNSSNGDAYASVPRSIDDQDSEVLLLGVTARKKGLDDSVYNTTVGVTNTGLHPGYPTNIVQILFYPYTKAGEGAPGGLWLEPNSVSYADLLQQLHYTDDTVAAVRVACHGDIMYLPQPEPTPQPCMQVNAHSTNLTSMVGESIPALKPRDAIQPGENGFITAMCDYSGAYSNLAFFSYTGAMAMIEAYDRDGAPIGRRTPLHIPAKTYVQQQLSDIIGPTNFSAGHVRVTTDNPLYAIGMRIDRSSKEPTIVVPKKY